ncbi:hypothetical protein BT96DRAFT_1018461 [Gymnopus androsaceus JB14]|uniref:Uncharacterized protein n=1 Tax=Gymnopus androsaceus JB14 TaxID=1447944 RepID=A0A6A4HT78_9AGAR|nr:hypothetical protein BT96DRAFT_1018461 [Gymnopus androsaceus JB14]
MEEKLDLHNVQLAQGFEILDETSHSLKAIIDEMSTILFRSNLGMCGEVAMGRARKGSATYSRRGLRAHCNAAFLEERKPFIVVFKESTFFNNIFSNKSIDRGSAAETGHTSVADTALGEQLPLVYRPGAELWNMALRRVAFEKMKCSAASNGSLINNDIAVADASPRQAAAEAPSASLSNARVGTMSLNTVGDDVNNPTVNGHS